MDVNKTYGPVKLDFNAAIDLISSLTNIFLTGFLIILSAFHGDIKALGLLVGMFIWYGILTSPNGLQYLLHDETSPANTIMSPGLYNKCNPFHLGWWETKQNPTISTTTGMLGMITGYLTLPMLNSPWRDENIGILVAMTILIAIVVGGRYKASCEGLSPLIWGLFAGLVAAGVWIICVSLTYPQGIYHGYFTNSAVCAVESKTFKCKKRKL